MGVKANRTIFDEMERNSGFKEFVGNALSHFLNVETQNSQAYEIPEGMSEEIWPQIYIQRDSSDGTIYVTEDGTIDE